MRRLWRKLTFGNSESSPAERSINVLAVLLLPITFPVYAITHPREAWRILKEKP